VGENVLACSISEIQWNSLNIVRPFCWNMPLSSMWSLRSAWNLLASPGFLSKNIKHKLTCVGKETKELSMVCKTSSGCEKQLTRTGWYLWDNGTFCFLLEVVVSRHSVGGGFLLGCLLYMHLFLSFLIKSSLLKKECCLYSLHLCVVWTASLRVKG